MFIELTDSERAPAAAMSWPGYSVFASDLGGLDRGGAVFNGVIHRVNGDNFISVSSSGTKTLIGTIPGSEYCYFASNSGVLVIVTGGSAYLYDGATLSTITDIDLGSPWTVATLNNYWIYASVSSTFTVSDFATPESIPTNYVASAESDGDNIVRAYSFQERIYFFGERTIEPWYFTGSGEPPLARETGGVIAKGLGARGSVANNNDFVFFLASDHSVYKLSGYQVQPVLNQQIAKLFEDYTISDARGYVLRHSGQDFYVIHFPTEAKTWAISVELGFAYQLSSQATSHLYCYNKNLVCVSDKLLQMDRTVYTNAGATMIRELIVGPITSKSLGTPGMRLLLRDFRLLVETGVSLVTGEGSDADVMFSISSDGGRTFTDDQMVSIGRLGDYLTDVYYYTVRVGMDFHIKIRVSDPIGFSVHDATADLELAGY
jgi:hypothetical protein